MSRLLLFVIALTLTASVHAEDSTEDDISLFSFDDHSIPWKSNLKLTMTPPQKHPNNPLIPIGKKGSCDEGGVQFYGSMIEHEGKFKLWYVALDDTVFKRAYAGLRVAYAESNDGIHWTKPNLGLVNYRGNTNNNLVAVDPPDACTIHLIVLHEADDPDPSRRFKMMMNVQTRLAERKQNVATSVAFYSADGLRWRGATKMEFQNGQIKDEYRTMPPVHFEQGGLFRWKGMYHLAGQQVTPWVYQPDGKVAGRVMTTYRSPDLIHWQEAPAFGFMRGTAIGIPGKPAEDEEAHLPSSVWHRNNVLLGVYGIWRGGPEWKDRIIDLGLNISNNGIHFREPIRDYVLIKAGAVGEWDVGGLLQGQGFAHVGDETYIYYGAWDLTVAPKFPPRGGVGVVKMRRDGFGYLSRVDQSAKAVFNTTTIHPKQKGVRLIANIDHANAGTPPIVELIDDQGKPIANYSGKYAAKLNRNGTRQKIIWPTKNSADIAFTEPFSIRVTLAKDSNAHIYALYADQN
ncbi:MAG: hypothetical protein K0U86_05655 [Planctomycetes bacterium]|nr:hypothetical protein [Planctomycetota bacterium]MCH9724374.1 hypothetical protein [Planctomycetota bacterium]MCH9776195.1 hypothetical protein [Planctomycetota bacterium]MCH9793438.1 hypothetical protein [Planctomycetota bacterium]